MHIEKSGGIEAYDMLFRRANTSVVHIGRRSGFDSDKRSEDAELGNAMFRCAVVSRKHAKIAFSDSGLVRYHHLSSLSGADHCLIFRPISLILGHTTELISVSLERGFLNL